MTPEERDALAGEYVLGTLEAREAAELRARMETDAELAAAVAAWEQRLAPLLTLAPPEAPPPELWARIERGLGLALAPATARPRWRFPWPALGLGASAVAAGLAAFILLRPAPQAPLMTVLLTSSDQPAWLVEAAGDTIRLAALNRRAVEPGRVAQLWALPQGATAPTSLGLVPEAGRFSVTPTTLRPSPGMLIEITLEPPGGSPTGRPTGPILFIGRLSEAGGS
ncbi:anti-sigma factor [Roseococcus pinisoli]|uniref:Anti-sigma factor n=1 Tax=Roseococcus pinisoli TaxID=2835040 RepID=A0ABS5Q763_9PROT|nr:anti-sigma factor [Roseococcus pinisoli]MBS7809475.1 anti-sigma factor [Roseococcus pinisoli]